MYDRILVGLDPKIEPYLFIKGGMFPSIPCSVCKETGHTTTKCPELSSEIRHPGPPQPTGPRGQGEEDD
jgi:hypothetical protein